MYGEAIQDSNLLSQLNSDKTPMYGSAVDDENILSQLDNKNSVPTFMGTLPKPTNIKEDLSKLGIELPLNEKERDDLRENIRERTLGATQALANYPIKAINLFKQNPIQEFNFAPDSQEAKRGKMIGDIGSFFMPGEAALAGIKGLSYIPKIGSSVNAISKAIESAPWLKSLLNIGRTAGETGLYNATQSPDDASTAFAQGAGLGGLTQTGINLLSTQNPFIKALARAGIGYGIGQETGHPYYGVAAATALPQLASVAGLTNKNAISQEMLEGLTARDISRAKTANDRLNVDVTPGQASGNYVTAQAENALKRTPASARVGYGLEKKQQRQQTNAINKMLNDIYQPTPQNEATIKSLYQQADRYAIKQPVIDSMKQNPVMEDAFKTVSNDPAFKNIPENSYKYLAEVKRQLYRDYQSSLINHPNSAHVIKNIHDQFNTFLKSQNPVYRAATEAAQPKIVREGIEEKFNKLDEDMTGKNFYNKFLNTRKSYQDILRQTKNFPQAQQAIKDMRQGWKNLSNIKTVSQAGEQSKSGIDQARDVFKQIVEAIKKYAGSKGDIKKLKFIYSKDWDKQFDKIMQSKDQARRNRDLMTLLGKIGLSYGLQQSQG